MTIGRSAAHKQLLQFGHLRLAGPGLDRLDARRVGDRGHLGQHVLRQRDHDRAGPALHRDVKGARDDFRDARGIVDLGRPFRRSSRTTRDSPSPGRPRARASPRSTWPMNRISGVESCSAMWIAGDALVAPGPRVTKQMPGRPVSRRSASAIIAAPPSCRQTVTSIGWRRAARRARRDRIRRARRRRARRPARRAGRRAFVRRCGS